MRIVKVSILALVASLNLLLLNISSSEAVASQRQIVTLVGESQSDSVPIAKPIALEPGNQALRTTPQLDASALQVGDVLVKGKARGDACQIPHYSLKMRAIKGRSRVLGLKVGPQCELTVVKLTSQPRTQLTLAWGGSRAKLRKSVWDGASARYVLVNGGSGGVVGSTYVYAGAGGGYTYVDMVFDYDGWNWVSGYGGGIL